jgi:hypothetical protein
MRKLQSYLFQVSTKSFFDRKINDDGCERYAMHDLMHELAECVSSGECKRITSPVRFVDVNDKIRHLHIEKVHDQNADNFKKIADCKNLLTLVVSVDHGRYSSKQMEHTIGKALENSKALRLIRINSQSIQVPLED